VLLVQVPRVDESGTTVVLRRRLRSLEGKSSAPDNADDLCDEIEVCASSSSSIGATFVERLRKERESLELSADKRDNGGSRRSDRERWGSPVGVPTAVGDPPIHLKEPDGAIVYARECPE